MSQAKTVKLKIKRQERAGAPSHYDHFEVPWLPQMNIISALMEVRKNPVTCDTKQKVAPVNWESNCLEEVCGACTMIVNGRVRQACTALIDQIAPNGEEISLEPMTKFPLVRDLVVDRQRMFNDLKTVKAWIQLDGTHELGAGPRQSPENQEEAYPLSRCMTCGSCLEACPQVNEGSNFIGPSAISQVRLFNLHPSGKMHAKERLEAVMGEDGVAGCGKAQNCVEVCPKEIPLVDSITQVSRQATKHLLFGWLFS
jgi:succinate dehydrogenase / fumarate reductase iron-sulfur subunit